MWIHATQSVRPTRSKPHGFMHTRFLIHNTHTHTHTHTHRLHSNHCSRLLPSPMAHAMSVCFLSSPSGSVDVLLLWQAYRKWQHDLYSSTNKPGNINSRGMAGGPPGNACDCVVLHFKVELQRSAQRAGCYEFNVSLSSALFSVGADCHFIFFISYDLPENEIAALQRLFLGRQALISSTELTLHAILNWF